MLAFHFAAEFADALLIADLQTLALLFIPREGINRQRDGSHHRQHHGNHHGQVASASEGRGQNVTKDHDHREGCLG